MARTNKFEISQFICPTCGTSFPLPRPKSCRREKGHVKDLWCPYCKMIVKTKEIRSRDIFRTFDGRIIY